MEEFILRLMLYSNIAQNYSAETRKIKGPKIAMISMSVSNNMKKS